MRAHNFQDLTGQIFGRLTVTSLDSINPGAIWKCRCICGRDKLARACQLKNGNVRSCGCLQREAASITGRSLPRKTRDISGQTFGSLTAVKPAGTNGRNVLWECLCECGTLAIVPTNSLTSGNTKSCGCRKNRRGGRTHLHERRAWYGMRQRCYNTNLPDYPHYGGRGIVVCDEWKLSFDAFLKDMGKRPSSRHSIDRKDNDGPYCPDNCRWAVQATQTRNQRRTHWIKYDGRRQSLADWAEEIGMSYTKLRRRIQLGWSAERALTTK